MVSDLYSPMYLMIYFPWEMASWFAMNGSFVKVLKIITKGFGHMEGSWDPASQRGMKKMLDPLIQPLIHSKTMPNFVVIIL